MRYLKTYESFSFSEQYYCITDSKEEFIYIGWEHYEEFGDVALMQQIDKINVHDFFSRGLGDIFFKDLEKAKNTLENAKNNEGGELYIFGHVNNWNYSLEQLDKMNVNYEISKLDNFKITIINVGAFSDDDINL